MHADNVTGMMKLDVQSADIMLGQFLLNAGSITNQDDLTSPTTASGNSAGNFDLRRVIPSHGINSYFSQHVSAKADQALSLLITSFPL